MAAINPQSSFLCWVDALGVEYLSYFIELAKLRGLSISVSVGRTDLPTITSINRNFFDTWPEESRRKIEELDDTKHHEKGGYKYGPSNEYPIHLAKELEIISHVIDEAATDLAMHKYDRYVIASDHGASRLAVIRKKEEKYDSDTHGEHSGRCCKYFENCDLPFAIKDHGYLILADYGRFKGSRAANVEVHGGAALEEVVVPVITLSLKDASIEIRIVEDIVRADYKAGATITLYVNKTISEDLSIELTLDTIKKAGAYHVGVFIGENLVSHLDIQATSKSGSLNSDFDDLF